jgi:outer membrane protein TolC
VIAERPDVRAYEYRLKSYFKNFESSQESLYPSITLNGSLSYKDNKFKNTFNVPTTGGSIGINLPFLNWNQVRWNIKTDQVSYELALINFESGITTALNEIDTNYSTYKNKKIELENIEAIFKSNSEVSKYYKDRYDAGVSEFRDWLSALASKNNSELKMISTKYDLISAEAKIYQSLAGKPLRIIEGVEL